MGNHGAGAYVITTVEEAQMVFMKSKQQYDAFVTENQTKAEQAARKAVKDWIGVCTLETHEDIGPNTESTDMEVKTLVKALRDFISRDQGNLLDVVTDCQTIARLFDEHGAVVKDALPDKPHFQELAELVKELDIRWVKVEGHAPMKKKLARGEDEWHAVPFTLIDQAARDKLKQMRIK